MNEIEITWFDTSDDDFEIGSVVHAAKRGFVYSIGNYLQDDTKFQFLAKEPLELDFDESYEEFHSEAESVANDLKDDWEYDPNYEIGDIITSTSLAFYKNKLELPKLGIALVWN